MDEISRMIAVRSWKPPGWTAVGGAGHDNFATFIAGNGKAPVAQRGKAKQKRSDLRLVGLGLVVTGTAGPADRHAYPATGPTSPSSPP